MFEIETHTRRTRKPLILTTTKIWRTLIINKNATLIKCTYLFKLVLQNKGMVFVSVFFLDSEWKEKNHIIFITMRVCLIIISCLKFIHVKDIENVYSFLLFVIFNNLACKCVLLWLTACSSDGLWRPIKADKEDTIFLFAQI